MDEGISTEFPFDPQSVSDHRSPIPGKKLVPMSPSNIPGQRRRPRWLVALVIGFVSGLLTWLALWLGFNIYSGLSAILAGLIGLICGLAAGRYYGAAGVAGIVLEALTAAGATIFGILAAIFGAFS